VLDCERPAIARTLDVPSEGPHGLWLDSGRLFCAADGGALVVLEHDNGDVLASLPLPGVPDVLMHDPNLERLYAAIGEPGLVCSFDTERLEQLESVETEQGGHTSCWDPISQCLYGTTNMGGVDEQRQALSAGVHSIGCQGTPQVPDRGHERSAELD
jgi:hypothetical protein